ncbi:MAG TPA: SDR family oxidoreductase [Patescibacteria group bacterium]|nr:SDR family oxidoreductase [Patescibacteria group bacterium]
MKTILVTGHLGYIGSILTTLLKRGGYAVVGLDTGYFKDCSFSTEDAMPPDYEIIKDVRKITAEDLAGIHAVCHLAALSNDPSGELNPGLTEEINYQASARLAELAKRAGAERFLFSSSCSMYGKSGDAPVDETCAQNPITAYARSKVQTEQALSNLADESFSPIYLRNATAYGVTPRMRLDLVVNNLMTWAVSTGKVHIMSDGTPWRPIVHAEDIARAFVALLEAPREKVHNEAFNIGANEENYQVREIAEAVAKVVPGSTVTFSDTPDKDSRSYRVSFDKLAKALPEFKFKWNLHSGAEQLFKHFTSTKLPGDALTHRHFIRLRQLKHLLENNHVDERLYWR